MTTRVLCRGGCGSMVIEGLEYPLTHRADGLCRKCRREIACNQRKQTKRIARQQARRKAVYDGLPA